MTNDGRRDCVHGFRWCAQCCWSGGRSTKEFLAGVASPPPGTVPGDQGGEPRRPQVGDWIEMAMGENRQPVLIGERVVLWERLSIDIIDDSTADVYLHAEGMMGWVALSDEGVTWRWPATQGATITATPMGDISADALGDIVGALQGVYPEASVVVTPPATRGAAVAGPVCVECGDLGGRWDEEAIDQWYPCRTCETDEPAPPPPASEPPRSYSPSCAGTCWPPCAHHGVEVALFMYKDRTRVLVQLAEVTAAKAALEAARDNAVRERDEARADRTRALALATEHLEAKAALEVQLRDEAEALEHECAAHVLTKRERDALAAQLKVAREALTLIRDGFDCRDTPDHQSHSRHCYVCMAAVALATPGARCHCTHEAGDSPCPIHDARSEDAMDRARAALAASGPVKEGT